jgi:starch phosphorylase
MSKQTRVSHPIYSLLPTDVDGFDSLAELALDMRWSWSHYGDKVWRQLDPELWELTQNPWVVLQTVSREKLEDLLTNTVFRREVDKLLELKAQGLGIRSILHTDYRSTCAKLASFGLYLDEGVIHESR